MADPEIEDDGHLDGCEIDFTEHAVDDETAAVVAMFADVPEERLEQLAEFYRKGAEADA